MVRCGFRASSPRTGDCSNPTNASPAITASTPIGAGTRTEVSA